MPTHTPRPTQTPGPTPTINPEETPNIEKYLKEYNNSIIVQPNPHFTIGDYETPLWFGTVRGQVGDAFD